LSGVSSRPPKLSFPSQIKKRADIRRDKKAKEEKKKKRKNKKKKTRAAPC